MNSILQPNSTLINREFKYLNLMCMMFVTIMLGTYILAYKMVSIDGYIQSGGIFIFPINYAIIDIITEVYGFEQTKKLIKNAFICCLFFATIVPLIAILPSPRNWPNQECYSYIIGNVFRFFIANTIGIVTGILFNGYLIARWKIILNGKYFWLRSIASSSIGELITSIIADILAFFGTTSFSELIQLMIAIYLVKFIYAVLLAWPNTLIVMHLKIKEAIDFNHESGLAFNPFSTNLQEKKNAY